MKLRSLVLTIAVLSLPLGAQQTATVRDFQIRADLEQARLSALDAIADGLHSEPRPDEVVEMCEEMVRDATVAAAVDGIAVDRSEMIDIEWRALLAAEPVSASGGPDAPPDVLR